jgi:hypothetical protein
MMQQVSRPVVCPAKAGVFSRRETSQGKSQSPVARRAGGRATNLLKPRDSLICGMGASLQAVAHANAQVAPPVRAPEAAPATVKGKAVGAVAAWLTRRTTPAGWERQHGAKDPRSHWRDPPRPAATSAEAREVREPLHRDIDRRREGDGGGRRSADAGDCPGSAGTLRCVPPATTWEAGVR